MNTSEMLCPICKLPLVSIESFCYEDEDVMRYSNYSEKWICATPSCICHTQNCYWNDDGDYFSGDISSLKIFPDGKYGALNSFAKKMEIEVYGKGLKKKIYLSPILTFGWLKPMIEIKYKGNEMGEVLGKSYKLKFLKKDGDRGYCTYYTSALSMLWFRIKCFKRDLKNHRKKRNHYTIKELSDEFKRNEWNNDWHYKLFHFIIEKIYYKTYKEVANYNSYKHIISKYRSVEITSEQYELLKSLCPDYIDLLSEIKNHHIKGDWLKQVIREAKLERIMND
jgi:hypothetical protein